MLITIKTSKKVLERHFKSVSKKEWLREKMCLSCQKHRMLTNVEFIFIIKMSHIIC